MPKKSYPKSIQGDAPTYIHQKPKPFVMICRKMLLDCRLSVMSRGYLAIMVAMEESGILNESNMLRVLRIHPRHYLGSLFEDLIRFDYTIKKKDGSVGSVFSYGFGQGDVQ